MIGKVLSSALACHFSLKRRGAIPVTVGLGQRPFCGKHGDAEYRVF